MSKDTTIPVCEAAVATLAEQNLEQSAPVCRTCKVAFEGMTDCVIKGDAFEPRITENLKIGYFRLSATQLDLDKSQKMCRLCFLRPLLWHHPLRREDPGFARALQLDESKQLTLYHADREASQTCSDQEVGVLNAHHMSRSRYTQTEPTDSDTTFALISHWLGRCDTNHDNCVRLTNASYLPRRLVHIGQSEGARIHLCHGSDLTISNDTRYIALSHCWGDQRPLCLTKANYHSMLEKIDHDSFPVLFRDLVRVSRILNIRYIWIDSLCIIQDDELDWVEQSTDMANIYAHSYLSIAAARAETCSQSMFTTPSRYPRGLADWMSVPWSELSSAAAIKVRMILSWLNWHETLRACPLMKRAWCLQERILAPRTLYFTNDQILWDCRTLRLSQVASEVPNEEPFSITGPCLLPSRSSPLGSKSHYSRWWSIVEEYSSCTLSFPDKDKLAAISGLARKFGREEDYCVGHWLSDSTSFLGLSWVIKNGGFRCLERAPSWSWASVDGTVCVLSSSNDFPNTPLADLLAVNETSRGIRGALQQASGRGHLVLSACLVRCTLIGSPTRWLILGCHPLQVSIKTFHDFSYFRSGDTLTIAMIDQKCLVSAIGPLPRHVGLILEQRGGSRGEFRRIGVATVNYTSERSNSRDDTSPNFRDFLTLMAEDQPEELYISKELRCDNRFDPVFAHKKQEPFPLWYHTIKIF